MKRANLIATTCFAAMVGMGMLMTAGAQDLSGLEKSILTFSGPIEIPGMTLQAGTYVFRRPDANTARVIQVFSQDEKNILGQFLTVPAKRLDVTADNVVTFKEKNEGTTPAVHYWYYPGRETGHEFIYPKEQAMRIAARTGEHVMSTEGTELKADAGAIERRPEPAAQPETQVASNADYNQNREMPRDIVGTSGQSDTAELPRTASPLPLAGLIGLLSLGGFAALRLRKAM